MILSVALLAAVVLFFYMTRFSEEDNQIIITDLSQELEQYKNIENANDLSSLNYISVFKGLINGYDIRDDETIEYYLKSQSEHFNFNVDYVDFWGRRKDRARVIVTIERADMKYVREHGNKLVEERITHMESDRGLIIHHLTAYGDILSDENIPFIYETVVFKVELVDSKWVITDESNQTLTKHLLGKYKYKFLYEDI